MKCSSCPVAEGLACIAEQPGRAFMCSMAVRGDPIELQHIVDRSATRPAYPPVLAQLGNLARAAVGFAASGFEVAGGDLAESRLAVCRTCPSGQYDDAANRCRLCGCYTQAKVRIAAETCPEGHW